MPVGPIGSTTGGADLVGADLRGADLRLADLTGADFRAADLVGASLADAIFCIQSKLDSARGDRTGAQTDAAPTRSSWHGCGSSDGDWAADGADSSTVTATRIAARTSAAATQNARW